MSYYCTMRDSYFYISKEDISKAVNAILESDFADTLQNPISQNANEKEVFEQYLEDNGYEAEFSPKGDIDGILFHSGKLNDDTSFFNTFAKYVAAGSYLEMVGESNDIWRMYFDGEECKEISPVIEWPDIDDSFKYKFHRDVEKEKFIDVLKTLGYSVEEATPRELDSLYDRFFDMLLEKEDYSSIFNDTVFEIYDQCKSEDERLVLASLDDIEDFLSENDVTVSKISEIEWDLVWNSSCGSFGEEMLDNIEFDGSVAGFVKAYREYIFHFDVDEYVAERLSSGSGPSAEELVGNGNNIRDFYEEISTKLLRAEIKEKSLVQKLNEATARSKELNDTENIKETTEKGYGD